MTASALPPATLRGKVACEGGWHDRQQDAIHDAKSGGNDGNFQFPDHD
jgi:hypothetical protein